MCKASQDYLNVEYRVFEDPNVWTYGEAGRKDFSVINNITLSGFYSHYKHDQALNIDNGSDY
jgi:hypothetical protein